MSWTHLRDSTPKASKAYHCDLCEREIAKGEVHVSRSGIADGGFSTSRFHLACEALTRDWDEDDWETRDSSAFRSEVLGESFERRASDDPSDLAAEGGGL